MLVQGRRKEERKKEGQRHPYNQTSFSDQSPGWAQWHLVIEFYIVELILIKVSIRRGGGVAWITEPIHEQDVRIKGPASKISNPSAPGSCIKNCLQGLPQPIEGVSRTGSE